MAFTYSNTTTYNLENVLRQNILNSDYYNKTCLELSTWEEVVDEIYEVVTHVEPWMSGNARGPSTAFCLLHRLMSLKLTVRQVRELIDHKDSPYIRAIGFLFLRYVCEPKILWQWCSNYAQDKENFAPGPDGKDVTMGDYVRDILLEQYYFETIFPRIPKPVMDSIVEDLKARSLPHAAKGNAGMGGADRRGVDDGSKRPASVKASLSVAMGQRAPNRSGAREERHGVAASKATAGRGAAPRSPLKDDGSRPAAVQHKGYQDRERRSQRDDGGRDGARGRDERDRDRDRGVRDDRERERGGRDERDRDRDRHHRDDRDRGGRDDRERDRDRGGRREYDSRRDDRDERGSRREEEPYRGRRDDDRSGRERERERERDRPYRDDRDRPRERDSRDRRSRSRSREDRGGGGERDARSVFRESAKVVAERAADVNAIKARYL